MALFGPLSVVRHQCARAEFHAAFAYAGEALKPGSAAHARIMALATGSTHREELPGGAHAIEMAYQTKTRPEGFFETHGRFIDLQVVVSGEELMEVDCADRLAVAQPYDEARDFTKHADSDSPSVLRIRPGDVAVFWPADAHMPSLAINQPSLVRKTVIKVPIPA
jgi:YhcH/YjgK/YiaL family protein